MLSEIRRTGAAALESGALKFSATREEWIEQAEIRFSVRVLLKKRNKPGRSASNPFLPYDPALHVVDMSESHVCLLNKYPAVPHHALLVTREFEAQDAPLTKDDFDAAWRALSQVDGLVFYNAGKFAGASQQHRHLQLLPTPIHQGEGRTPIDAVLARARFTQNVGRTEGLPFLHGIARMRNDRVSTPQAAAILHGLYSRLARAFACDRPGRPYNLLLTRDWMMLVPRRAGHWEGIGINALGFAGALLVKDESQFELLRRIGPLNALRHVAIEPAP